MSRRGWVYFIKERIPGDGGVYTKIGCTEDSNCRSRLNQLQVGNPRELYIYDKISTKDPFRLESLMHAYFEIYRTSGEWFELEEHWIDTVCDLYDKYGMKFTKEDVFAPSLPLSSDTDTDVFSDSILTESISMSSESEDDESFDTHSNIQIKPAFIDLTLLD